MPKWWPVALALTCLWIFAAGLQHFTGGLPFGVEPPDWLAVMLIIMGGAGFSLVPERQR